MFRRWFLSRCISLALLFSFIGVAEAAKKTKLPPLLQEIEAKYAKAATLEAEFEQINEVAAMNQKKSSSGIIMIKRPDKIRWQTNHPDPSVLVSDGKRFWFYTPPFEEGEHGQVIERKSSEIQSRLAQALLSGSFSVAKDMKIKQVSRAEFLLTPKQGTSGTVATAKIGVDRKNRLIKKVILTHEGGNKSEITLSNIRLGNALGDDIFTFVPPANTDRVKE